MDPNLEYNLEYNRSFQHLKLGVLSFVCFCCQYF